MLAARAYRDLSRLVVKTIFAGEFCANGGFKFGDAINGGIFSFARMDGSNSRSFDIFRRVEIGLTRAQADDVLALRLKLGRFG